MHTIKTVCQKKFEHSLEVIAIVKAKDWYIGIDLPKPLILEEDFIVCRWHDFHDGEKSNIEGRTTIAICRNYDDASTLWLRHV